MNENATSFGRQAATYAKGRPGYPADLFQWIAENSPGHDMVWDVGTGSGQAARTLASHFKRVHATDISAEQIASADPHPRVNYHTAEAHESGVSDSAVDAVTIATALHWFASKSFWDEVARVAKPGALFCGWTYQLPRSTQEIHETFLDPLYALIDPLWADGNRLCMAGYTAQNLNCPFPTVPTPKFDAGGLWSANQLVNFTESWSAHFRARENGLTEELNDLTANFLDEFTGEDIQFSLPLSVLAGNIE